MHQPLPTKAASPRSISITSTTGRVLLSSQAQHKGDRFKIPAHPDPLTSSSTHWFSTCMIEGTSLPPSTPARRAPGSQQAAASIPHPTWVHFQSSPARRRSWGTPEELATLWAAAATSSPKDLHPIAAVTLRITTSLSLVPAARERISGTPVAKQGPPPTHSLPGV